MRLVPPFRTLRTRLTVLYAGLFTVGLAVLAVLAQVMIERSARSAATDELATSASVYDRLWQERERALTGAADVVARDFGFRSAVASNDVATIVSALDSLRARADVPHVVLVTDAGRVIGDAGELGGKVAAFVGAIEGDRRDAVVASARSANRIVTAPILAPNEIGRIAFVIPLGASEMRGLEKLFAMPLTAQMLTRTREGAWSDGHLTLPADTDRAITSIDAASGQAQAALLLSYPMTRAMQPYRSIQLGLITAGLVWLVTTVLGTGRLARGIAQPIAALDAAARRLEEGERAEVSVDSDDEVGRLAQSFNRMSLGIKEREQRITHLAFHDGLTDLPNRVQHRLRLPRKAEQKRKYRSGTNGGRAIRRSSPFARRVEADFGIAIRDVADFPRAFR